MLNTLMELHVQNGLVLETYTVEQDVDGAIFLRNVMDSEIGGPMDTMYIDPSAAWPIARALILAAARVHAPVYVDIPNVVRLPVGRA